jgi:hypothetical protein
LSPCLLVHPLCLFSCRLLTNSSFVGTRLRHRLS